MFLKRPNSKFALAMLAATAAFIGGQALAPSQAVAADDEAGVDCALMKELGFEDLPPECGSAGDASGGDAGSHSSTDDGVPGADVDIPDVPIWDPYAKEREGDSGRCSSVLTDLAEARRSARIDAGIIDRLEGEGYLSRVQRGALRDARINLHRERKEAQSARFHWFRLGCEPIVVGTD
jgi:hypothetical protein